MSRTKWYLRKGTAFSVQTNQSTENNHGFDLEKFVKKALRHFNVDAHDACCGVSIDETATATVEQVERGLIYSTSAAAVSITLPDAEDFKEIRGRLKYFVVDNSVGANTVTIVAGSGITTASAITGGDDLTVADGEVGKFQLYFISATEAILSRLV